MSAKTELIHVIFLWDEIALKYNSGVLNKMHWDKRMDYQSWILRWFHDIRDHTRRYTPKYSYLDSMLKMNRCILLEVKSDTLVLFNICTNYHHTVILIKISIHYDADVFGSNMYYIVWFIRSRDHYGYGFDQWEKALHSNAISHWWSPYTELSLRSVINHGGYHVKYDKLFSISNQTVSHTHTPFYCIHHRYITGNKMPSSNGNIFRVTDHLRGESIGNRWIPLTKASDAEVWCFIWAVPEQMVEQTMETPVI